MFARASSEKAKKLIREDTEITYREKSPGRGCSPG